MFSKDFLNEEAKCELNKVVESENKPNRNNLIYIIGHKKKNRIYDFQKFKTITSFGKEIYHNDLSLNDALKLQVRLKDAIDILKESTKPKESVKNSESS